jgi:NAD(P)-dependent dehydrogenase (short-subunit alcohol dehydrogenase family)
MIFEDRVAVLTASAQGIGRAIAIALASEGMDVVIADIDADAASATADEIRAAGRRALVVPTDVGSDDAVAALVQRSLHEFGQVDLLLNHAGRAIGGPIEEIPIDEWTRLLEFNLGSQIRGVKAFLPHLVRSAGWVVNTSSSLALVAGHPFAPLVAPYVTSKAAIITFTQLLAQSLRPRGVGVSVLVPDHTATAFNTSIRFFGDVPAGTASTSEGNVHEQIQTPAQVADAFVEGLRAGRFLLSPTPDLDHRLERYAGARFDPSELADLYTVPS